MAKLILGALASAAALGALIALMRARRGGSGFTVLAALVDAADGPRLVTDQSGKVLELNAAARDWLGGASPLDFLETHADKDTAGEALVRLRQAADTRLAAAAEVPLAGAGGSGEIEWFDVSVRPLPAIEDAMPGHS